MLEYASAIAGLGLLLSGLHLLSASMKPFAGKRIRSILSKLTDGYLNGAFAGVFLGSLTQSTSGATFICMGLVNSGTLRFEQTLRILAWSSVGGSLIVFLASVDIRLAGLLLLGLVGLSHLFNADRVEKVKYLVALFFALGLMFLGLGMVKEGAHLLRESDWIKEFIEFASENATICFIIGLLFSLITQSASTVTIIGITLVIAKIIPFDAVLILVLGANVGSGLGLFLITSHLTGIHKQISFYQFLTKLSGVFCLVPILLLSRCAFGRCAMDVNNTAYLISVFYLALQVSGAIFVSLFQTKIIKILGNIFPESEEESLSKMKFISPETSEDPAIAISLVKKEQDRLISTLSYYLEPLRTEEYAISLKVRNDANLHLAGEIKSYIDEISHHDLGEEMSNLLELQSRNEAIISLLASLNTFTSIVSETKDYKEGLSGALIEGLHLILTLLEETVTSNENNEVLIELTSDKSQLMDNIRAALISDESTSVNDRKALFVCTRVFERIVWQIRQMQLSNLRFG